MRRARFKYKTVLLYLLVMISIPSFSNDILFSDKVIGEFQKIQPINRDKYADSLINKIIKFRGKIISLDQKIRYKRHFRIIAEDDSINKFSFKYYIFLEKKDTWSQFIIDQNYNFTGQIINYTPAGSSRESYIFDVLLSSSELITE